MLREIRSEVGILPKLTALLVRKSLNNKNPASMSNEQLAIGVRASDPVCEAELVRRFLPGLVIMLTKRSGDPHLAEDLAQDTLMTVIKRLRTRGIERPESLAAFVYQTGKFVYLGWLRKSSTQAEKFAVDESELTIEARLEENAIRQAEIDFVHEVITDMKVDRDKEILTRSYVLDHSKKEICEALDLSDAHYDRVIHRARARFKLLYQFRTTNEEVI